MEKSALVIGGGIAGIQASLDLADRGIKVFLVESEPTIGGKMARLDKTFPTNDCSACILSPKMADVGGHQNITVLSYSEVLGLEGQPGNFKAKILKKARYVDEDKCTGCGDCVAKCPTKKITDQFEFGLATRKAIFIPHAQAVPRIAVIDPDYCRYLTEGKCGVCMKVCQRGAINYEDKDKILDLDVGAVICATGFDVWDAKIASEYGYGRYPNVVNSMEYERIMCASGPLEGHIARPSDGQTPKRIAFIQCVGSRSEKKGWKPYCSSVCCMYAIKQAIIGMEHLDGVSTDIFFMDIRSYGKEFEDYKIRAAEEYDIGLHQNARVASIDENPITNNLYLRYSDGSNEPAVKEFDLVVLSVALNPSTMGQKLAGTLGFDLNKYGFCDTSTFAPLETSRPGVFVTGAFAAPKDIPTSVAEASGSAVKAGALIATQSGWERAKPKEFPSEIDVEGQEPRIGFWVCSCGINIGSTVDVDSVQEYAAGMDNVVLSRKTMYACAQDTLEEIKETIKAENLNRVVVASCTPRTHEPLFRNACKEAGLNPYLFELANIRDQCSWIHMHEPEKATKKAKDLVRMALAKSRLLEPLDKGVLPVAGSAVVLGGGIAGMTSALDIASQGYDVHIVEKTGELGGNAKRFHYMEDGKDVKSYLNDLIDKVRTSDKITVHLNSEAENIEGFVGAFKVKIPDAEIDVGSVIVAVGGYEYKPTEYKYGADDRVMTILDFEEKMAANQFNGKNVAFISCVGSRNDDAVYCSRVCCSSALRSAIQIKEADPEANVFVLHKDIRTYGFREEYYRRASELGVNFIRYPEDKEPVLNEDFTLMVNDTILGDDVVLSPDALILNAGIRPNPDNEQIAPMLKIPLSKDGFFFEAHMKLRPVDFATEGVFLAGLAHWPKFMDESIAQASGAASRALTIISSPTYETEGVIAAVNDDLCDGCGICEGCCPYHAITIDDIGGGHLRANVNEGLCKGCGSCVGACPSGAMEQKGFKGAQLYAMIKAALEE